MCHDARRIDGVIGEERKLLGLEAIGKGPACIGLALSGGGIRSASFALGVVQQLAVALTGGLRTFHYLSSVSGGGYMGTAISWLRHHYGEAFEGQLGSKERGDRSAELQDLATTPGAQVPKTWLDYVRMHGNYLLPPKITVLSLVGVGLRSLLFTVVVYGGAAVAVLAILNDFGVLPSWCPTRCEPRLWYAIERWVVLSLGVLAAHILLYGLASWLTSVPVSLGVLTTALAIAGGVYAGYELLPFVRAEPEARWPYVAVLAVVTLTILFMASRVLLGWLADPASRSLQAQIRLWSYRLRTRVQQTLGAVLGISLGLLILWSTPSVYHALRSAASWAPAALGGGSSLLTGIGTILKVLTGQKKNPNPGFLDRAVSAIAPILGAAAVVYGGLILAYGIQAGGWYLPGCPGVWVARQMNLTVAAIVLVGVLVLGFFCNANYLSLGRMYRDRLMEMFMPNRLAIETTEWQPATEAEDFLISDLLPDVKGSKRLFHLVCCNVILTDAVRDSFRGRGGDSFTFSPLYSGSSATGWAPSDRVAGGGMSLATAMATSGAAANPDAAVAGAGLTRNRLVAFLMWMFNVRLGCWLRNPQSIRASGREPIWPPNFWVPGLWQGLLGRALDEDANYVELSDGGHFDNTGLYELIRRRVDIIVLSQASADPNYVMDDLANAIERVRADFGVHIRFDIPGFEPAKIRPRRTEVHGKKTRERYADRGYALARIHYPKLAPDGGQSQAEGQTTDWENFDTGYLLYLQATKIEEIRSRIDIDSYARVHPDFPNESTANQFFDEDQLEAYRELGMEITQQAFREIFRPEKPDVRNLVVDHLARELGVR
jgi:predicted acylesterase/phospholipase RssA